MTHGISLLKLTSMKIDGATKTYGIIGWPVKHSLSPLFQADFLLQKGINAAYLPFAVAPDLLESAMDGLWAIGVEGFNVTVPHKESVFQMVSADRDASLIGAVNTVKRAEHGWAATNTDWRGFSAVVDGLGFETIGKSALLFGAGGTARAVLHALAQMELDCVYVCNRNPDRLAAFISFAEASYAGLKCRAVSWQQEEVSTACQKSELLINTTSIGLQAGQGFPFDLSAGSGVAIDAVYSPDGKTAFTLAASASRNAVDGLPMLIAQGAEAFAWWHGCSRPDCSAALTQMEQQLGRNALQLPGWG